MKSQPAKPGHLSANGLNLKQSEQVRASLSKKQSGVEAFKKLKPAPLNWAAKAA